jgi:hypothetical protein
MATLQPRTPDLLRLYHDGTLFCIDGTDVKTYLREWAKTRRLTEQSEGFSVNIIEHDRLEQVLADAEMFQWIGC